MGINLNQVEKKFKEDSGIWFTYPDDEDVKLKVRPLFPDKANQLAKKSTKKKRNGIKEIDQEKLSKLTNRYIIEDFEGIELNGSIECNDESLEMLSKYCGDIILFAIEKSKELANDIIHQNEEELKN